MSGAAMAVQTALVAALQESGELGAVVSGVFDGAPPRSDFPYVVIDEGATRDWSHKSGRGREHRLGIAIWDDGLSPARLLSLVEAAEAAIEAMPSDLGGHRLASLSLIESRVARDPDGPWCALVRYRARTLEI